MSQRTSEAAKAIRKAWQRELELVQEGKGTREWTPEQQRDIVVYGKAYDENGKAFQGHHMISVEKNPEFQGCPGNIQFLSPGEHKKAHNGDFHNLTNGYYDPFTDTTKEFVGEAYEPCKVIELNEPVAVISESNEDIEICRDEAAMPDKETSQPQVEELSSKSNEEKGSFERSLLEIDEKKEEFKKRTRNKMVDNRVHGEQRRYTKRASKPISFWDKCKYHLKNAGRIIKENPELIVLFVDASVQSFNAVSSRKKDIGNARQRRNNIGNTRSQPLPPLRETISEKQVPDIGQSPRSSPQQHIVREHGQHYGKDKVWKQKTAYTRGGKDKNS